MNSIIEVDNVSFSYGSTVVLDGLSLEVPAGSFLATVGPNGAGKSTLLNLLCGVLKPRAGSIRVDGACVQTYSVRELAQKTAVVRQEFVPVFDFTVVETVSMARAPYTDILGFETERDRQIVAEALEMTDTQRFSSRKLAELSGGERQRVFIARALAQDTQILLLDEPATFLDMRYQVGIYDLLKRMQLEKGKTILAVTHNINLATQYCDRVLLLGQTGCDAGYLVGTPGEVLSPEHIEKAFGVRPFCSKIGADNFFLPVGKFAKYSRDLTGQHEKRT
jgi:iron complex transport system ATP-binding protein